MKNYQIDIDMRKSLMKPVWTALLCVALHANASAAVVREVPTDNVPGPAQVTVALPENYSADGGARYPVIYLLNGHGGNHTSWAGICNLDSMATRYNVIFVCPAGQNSWYWDAPADSSMRMESFITDDLVPWVDSTFRTVPKASQRAVTGLSMGGHGALWLALRHPDVFGNCGSTSGGVDIRPFPGSWNMARWLGTYSDNSEVWDSHTVMNLVDRAKEARLCMIFDCGTDDFFFAVNNAFDKALTDRGVMHLYLTSPGAHNGAYWSESILPQVAFFRACFDAKTQFPNTY